MTATVPLGEDAREFVFGKWVKPETRFRKAGWLDEVLYPEGREGGRVGTSSMASAATSLATTWSMASLSSALPSNRSLPAASLRFPSTAYAAAPSQLRLSPVKSRVLMSFSGLAPARPLLSFGPDDSCFEYNLPTIDNGSRFFAMRHGRKVPKLNRPPDQRRALLRGLTTQLLKSYMPCLLRSQTGMEKGMEDIQESSGHCQGEVTMRQWPILSLYRDPIFFLASSCL
ncbi:hypothetical protein H6P81_014724 [Aristolochia fimbriata]|uniref:Uncharacterized protein n=1 Tax=Aristolochia fimbriata TaxID=158543 RepID=A0AAV7E4D3_ARIFI|nr:hypothetical protein H6P81_014724 [Aristolochia fimbriata]